MARRRHFTSSTSFISFLAAVYHHRPGVSGLRAAGLCCILRDLSGIIKGMARSLFAWMDGWHHGGDALHIMTWEVLRRFRFAKSVDDALEGGG